MAMGQSTAAFGLTGLIENLENFGTSAADLALSVFQCPFSSVRVKIGMKTVKYCDVGVDVVPKCEEWCMV